jgi:hypothetical protein
MPAHSPKIGIFPADQWSERQELFCALTELFGVSFVPGRRLDPSLLDAALFLDGSAELAQQCARTGVRSMAYVQSPPLSRPYNENVTLSDSAYLAPTLRGLDLPDRSVNAWLSIDGDPEDEILARGGDNVLWVHRRVGRSTVDMVAGTPPSASESSYLYTKFDQLAWFSLLPLLHFVRRVSGWTYPAARACFMFDDPNLHWSTYGYVNYPELLAESVRHNYHVSFATVPMDLWYVHRPTARLFTEGNQGLSLLIHGNNHTYQELQRESSMDVKRGLAAQALQRIRSLEERTGIRVSRVMAAPHGACSSQMATALLEEGFEAACISRGSLMARNPEVPWRSSVGLHPAEYLGDGLPVIPRFSLHSDAGLRSRFAAFLGQAIIPVGHHDDLRDGTRLLSRIAHRIDSLGDVEWTDMTAICRSNYLSRVDGSVMRIRPYSRNINVDIPCGVTHCVFEGMWPGDQYIELEMGALTSEDASRSCVNGMAPFAVLPRAKLNIKFIRARVAEPKYGTDRMPIQAILRRQVCEVRDRLRPSIDLLRPRIFRRPLRVEAQDQ